MSRYPEALRTFVLKEYAAGRGARSIFEAVMREWPDCGMQTPQSIAMMVGANKQRLASGSYRPPREADPKPEISLAGPVWSKPARGS